MKKILLVLLCFVATFSNTAFADKPNIILILADDLGCMDVGALMPTSNTETSKNTEAMKTKKKKQAK
jgi:hypothetical protein